MNRKINERINNEQRKLLNEIDDAYDIVTIMEGKNWFYKHHTVAKQCIEQYRREKTQEIFTNLDTKIIFDVENQLSLTWTLRERVSQIYATELTSLLNMVK